MANPPAGHDLAGVIHCHSTYSDGTGTVQTEYTYEPFGGTTTSGATTSNTRGFTGREADGSCPDDRDVPELRQPEP